ncbi:RluA family pseudouridine synthase [Mangrovivirga sp. M17]|uniref:RluA family pseudouridine synthase n=1 Tax=Mangrovivirga halotolerans TaxID=2993936 RepID=A0ABT3RNG8_9BACT|nr:RluA family pseudouridine synthase [Mangrovivirga halotolerans]MCX2742914.1 RluA family pseudouridine synthase [Mangrovivirga halotolerans]
MARKGKHIEIVYEDNHLIAVNKPSGVLVHSDRTEDPTLEDAVKDFIKVEYNKPGAVYLGVIHRLDRPVSGLVLMAKTSKGLSRMNEVFKERKVEKTYLAIVNKLPANQEGTLEHYLLKDTAKNKTHAHIKPKKGAKKAVLSYKFVGRIADKYLLEVKPETGRPHQIRVQLSSMGCPIQGDVKYGSTIKNPGTDIALHGFKLNFQHPVKKEHLEIKAEVPGNDLWKSLKPLTETL